MLRFWWFGPAGVAEDTPLADAAVFDKGDPGGANRPALGKDLAINAPSSAGHTGKGDMIPSFEGLFDLDVVIGVGVEEVLPPGDHLLCAGEAVAEGVDERVIVRHHVAQGIDVMTIDRIDKPVHDDFGIDGHRIHCSKKFALKGRKPPVRQDSMAALKLSPSSKQKPRAQGGVGLLFLYFFD